MKKNLRIVSATDAALLAIAPVAATAVSVNAADATNTSSAYTTINAGGATINTPANVKYDVDVTPDITAISATGTGAAVTAGSLTSTITASYNGQSYTATLSHKDGLVSVVNNKNAEVKDYKELTNANIPYTVTISGVSFNFGPANTNKKITLGSTNNNVTFSTDGEKFSSVVDVATGQNGALEKDETVYVRVAKVNALDLSNVNGVNFYQRSNGNQVKSGTVSLTAGLNGRLNVSAVAAEILKDYQAAQSVNNQADNAGWFTSPTTFTVNVKATSSINGTTASLPITVNVTNGVNSTVASVSKRIMHYAYYYDKDAKRVGTDSVKRYASVSVLPNTTINGKAYYQVVENGKAVDKYINAANIDGTKRTLKHNAYVYASSKKRANKVVLKKGEVVTTYGTSYTFKNGQKYYKIGDNTDKTYVKVANFN